MQQLNETQRRLYEKLYNDMGSEIISYLKNKTINEIMLNPDGSLWADHALLGLAPYSKLERAQAVSIINTMAGINNSVISSHHPKLEAELPYYKGMNGERFTAQIPPIVSNPSFTIRKKTESILKIDDYISSQRLTQQQAFILRQLIQERKNILVCGGPGVGKTTVTNALIAEAVLYDENQRIIILEDVPELLCHATNKVAMVTTSKISLSELLRSAMRMRPDRILIGEVRGREAFDLLKAWNTGCPGGICTIHANGAQEAVQRVLDLAMEAELRITPITLILHTINIIASVVRKNNQKGFIQDIVALRDYTNEKFIFEKLA